MTLRELLAPREFEVATLIHDGYSNREVAKTMGIQPCSVKATLTRIFDKAGVWGRVELAVRYERENP